MNYTRSDAYFDSPNAPQYRFQLIREWDNMFPDQFGKMCFIMLNPSTANATTDDPTIRRCVSFAKREGCNKLVVVNLFSIISPDPVTLKGEHTIGNKNDALIVESALTSDVVVCAWGSFGKYIHDRDIEVMKILEMQKIKTMCLGITKDGYPRHPLYVAGKTELIKYSGR